MPTSGWLISGVTTSPPSFPALVTVNVDPRSSSGSSEPARAASARRPASAASSVDGRGVAAADDGDDEALIGLDGEPEVVAVEVDDLVAFETRVQLGELAAATAPSPAGRAATRSDRSTSVKSHSSTYVTAGISRCDVDTCSTISRRMPRSGSRRPSGANVGADPSVAADSAPARAHVLLGDAAAGAAALDGRQLDAELLREAPDERRRTNSGERLGGNGGDDRLVRRRSTAAGSVVDGAEQLLAFVSDHDQDGTHRRHVTLGDEDPQDCAPGRRGDLDGRLVRLDLDERIVLGDRVTLGDEPARDLALRQALAEIRKLELVRHARPIVGAGLRRAASPPRTTDDCKRAWRDRAGTARRVQAPTQVRLPTPGPTRRAARAPRP